MGPKIEIFSYYINDGKLFPFDAELDFVFAELEPVNPFCIVLVMGAGVLAEQLHKAFPLVSVYLLN